MANKGVFLTVNASGAVDAAKAKNVVVIVDVISMSTTLEAAIDAGALQVFGASPDNCKAPVKLLPHKIGFEAGKIAAEKGTGVIVVSEPRVGDDKEREIRAGKLIAGVREGGGEIHAILPNLGAETAKLTDFKGKIVVAVTDTGGVAFDAAYTAGAPAVLTGTIARTMKKKGAEPAIAAARRAVHVAEIFDTGISVVAASGNSLEDILAAEYIFKLIIEEGFVSLRK